MVPEQKPSRLKTVAAFVFIYVVIVLGALPFVAPQSTFGWAMLLIVVPPLYLVGESVVGKLDGSMGEGSLGRKLLKAFAFIVLGLFAVVLQAFFAHSCAP